MQTAPLYLRGDTTADFVENQRNAPTALAQSIYLFSTKSADANSCFTLEWGDTTAVFVENQLNAPTALAQSIHLFSTKSAYANCSCFTLEWGDTAADFVENQPNAPTALSQSICFKTNSADANCCFTLKTAASHLSEMIQQPTLLRIRWMCPLVKCKSSAVFNKVSWGKQLLYTWVRW